VRDGVEVVRKILGRGRDGEKEDSEKDVEVAKRETKKGQMWTRMTMSLG
jgi:hypothetical protein